MDPKYKTIIPLVAVFFVFGIVVGYVVHKPETIEKIEYINKTVEVERIVTVTVTVTPTTTPTPTPTATQAVSDFIVKIYEPSKDTPAKTIELTSRGADPNVLSIRSGDTVLIKITGYSQQSPLKLNLTSLNMSQERNLGTSGAVVVTFNTKGTYSFKAIIPSGDPNVLPRDYAAGTITVY